MAKTFGGEIANFAVDLQSQVRALFMKHGLCYYLCNVYKRHFAVG